MVESEKVKELLITDPEIEITGEDSYGIYFTLYERKFGTLYYKEEERTKEPVIFILDSNDYSYPHIMTHERELSGKKYRAICLYEQNTVVSYITSYEAKLEEAISRLKELLKLSSTQIEQEFQKEFLFYWEDAAVNTVELFLNPKRVYQNLNLYQHEKSPVSRAVSHGLKLNDSNDFKIIHNIESYYIPINDERKMIPPLKDKPWTIDNIMDIIECRHFKRISDETYDKLKKVKCTKASILLVFDMIIEGQRYNFATKISFKISSDSSNLLEKLRHSVSKIEPIRIFRCDYTFLNEQIGNDTSIVDKKVAIIGCGSLGSYVAEELVKSGIKKLTIYDDDDLMPSNILRHRAEFDFKYFYKVDIMKFKLERINPEVFIENKNTQLTDDTLKEDMNNYDLIIFTVGSSDVQLSSNKIFHELRYKKPVIYVWLEGGGIHSHILTVNYSEKGCFECLFTDKYGNLINNKVNRISGDMLETKIIRNGCGATRVAYGTSILLRTTSVLLDIVKKVFNNTININNLIDILPMNVISHENDYIEGKCQCCGDRDS